MLEQMCIRDRRQADRLTGQHAHHILRHFISAEGIHARNTYHAQCHNRQIDQQADCKFAAHHIAPRDQKRQTQLIPSVGIILSLIHISCKLSGTCPVEHPKFFNGKKNRGCTKYITIPNDLRLSIDRNSRYFKNNYSLRTECERYNSRFKNTGQERMWVRNKSSVANLNTLAHISLLAVSYTHLDVYKRQFQVQCPQIPYFQINLRNCLKIHLL